MLNYGSFEDVHYLAQFDCDAPSDPVSPPTPPDDGGAPPTPCTFGGGADIAILLDASGSICNQEPTCQQWNDMQAAGAAAIDALGGANSAFWVSPEHASVLPPRLPACPPALLF